MKSNTLALSAIAFGLFAVAGSQVFSSLTQRQQADAMTPGSVSIQPVRFQAEKVTLISHDIAVVTGFEGSGVRNQVIVTRAWSDGRVEARSFSGGRASSWLVNPAAAATRWTEIGNAR